MKKERLGITPDGEAYDAKTGEFKEEGSLIWVSQRKKSQFGKDFYLMAIEALSFLSEHRKEIGGEGFAVFGKMLLRLDFENWIHVSQKDIAEELQMQKGNVSRAISKLIATGILLKGPKSGTAQTYRLHPDFAWRGSSKTHRLALDEARLKGWRLIPGGAGAAGNASPEDENQMDLPF